MSSSRFDREQLDLINRARWMLKNGMRPNHSWDPSERPGAWAYTEQYSHYCNHCPYDSPFKTLAWAHPAIIEEDEL